MQFTSRDRCAGYVIILEVNRPPTNCSAGNEVITESPSSRRSVEPSTSGVFSNLEHAEGQFDSRCQRRRDEEDVYVELDVDCAPANRQHNINPSKYAPDFCPLFNYLVVVKIITKG